MSSMEALMSLTSHMSASLGRAPQAEWSFRYNDRYGNLVNLETDEDVRLMMKEWLFCDGLSRLLSDRSVRNSSTSFSAPARPSVDPRFGVRAEIHVSRNLINQTSVSDFGARDLVGILANTIAFTNEFADENSIVRVDDDVP